MRNCRAFISAFVLSYLIAGLVHAENSETASPQKSAVSSAAVDAIKKDTASAAIKSNKNLPSDVRVLVDISGSMKQTDPKNLRKPALDLIVRLLPDKSRAGVWTFGNDVNPLVPLRTVDAGWRHQAAPKANEITSSAMFTNIGKALEAVSFDSKNLSSDYKTHIVLLTDGVVDIGKDAVVNNKERQRIISEILPNLKTAGYTVHTIALSPDADMDLLKKLSVATDGVATTAVSADQLMGVFLKIFDQAVPAERVPLENNGFLVDASIKEFTALIFRKPDNDRTVIAAPDGKEYSATSPADGINWYRTDKYDLITADSPKAGQWKIKTEIAPRSRITVVSNLQMVVEPPRNNLHTADTLTLAYSFQENGKTIVSKDFLDLLEVNAIIAKENTEENTELAFDTSKAPADGIYHQNIDTFATEGDYEIHVYVDGKTFKREFKHSLSVRDSMFTVEKSSAAGNDGKVTYSYKITTDEKAVDPKKTQLSVAVKNPPTTQNKPLSLQEPNRWEFSFSPTAPGEYKVELHAQGEMLDGTKFDEVIKADSLTFAPKAVEEKVISKEEPAAKPKQEEAKPKDSNLLLYVAIGLGNLTILILGYFGYRILMGGKAKDELEEIEKTLADVDKKPVKAAAKAAPEKKAAINLSDDEPASIPMNDDNSLDKLFPLDSMEDPNNDENNL